MIVRFPRDGLLVTYTASRIAHRPIGHLLVYPTTSALREPQPADAYQYVTHHNILDFSEKFVSLSAVGI